MIYPKLSDGTIDWCAMCKRRGSDIYDLCCMCSYVNEDDPPSRYEPIAKPITKGDRIRSMSDEELAAFLVRTMTCSACRDMHGGKCPKQPGEMETCKEMILDWLKQEAQDG